LSREKLAGFFTLKKQKETDKGRFFLGLRARAYNAMYAEVFAETAKESKNHFTERHGESTEEHRGERFLLLKT